MHLQRLHLDSNQNTGGSGYSGISNPLPCHLGLYRRRVGRGGLEPPGAEKSGFTDRNISRFALEVYIRQGVCLSSKLEADTLTHCYQLRGTYPKALHTGFEPARSRLPAWSIRGRTGPTGALPPSRTNGFQDRSLTTRTCSV